jgi:uncharacterized protein (TIGR00645 family)
MASETMQLQGTGQEPSVKADAGLTWRDHAEDVWENKVVFGSRWLLAPAYLMLVLVLAVLAYKTVEEFFQLLIQLQTFNEVRAIAQILIIVDIVLVMNLVLMVLFVGYINFVSIINFKKIEDKPVWLGSLDYSGLKIQLIGSIIAISGIMLLRVFIDTIDTNQFDTMKILLLISLHMTFVISALVLAMVNKLKHSSSPGAEKVGPL